MIKLISMKTYEFSRRTWKYCKCSSTSAEKSILKQDGKLYADFICDDCQYRSFRIFDEEDCCFVCPVGKCEKIMSFDEFKEEKCCFQTKLGTIRVVLWMFYF